MAAKKTKLDPRSAEVVLFYVGDGRAASGAPADDLTENALARLVYVRSLEAVLTDTTRDKKTGIVTGTRPDHLDPDPELAAALIDELLETGLYSKEAPPKAKAAKGDKADKPAAEVPAPAAASSDEPQEAPASPAPENEDAAPAASEG